MNPWTFHKHSGSDDEFVEIAWDEVPSGFEMRVTRNRGTSRYAFSTAEQLNQAVQRCKNAALCDGFRPVRARETEN